MAKFSIVLKKLICLFVGHDYWLVIKTILPYFPDDKIRYKTKKYCIRCNKMED
jgi:hypothetical protein